MTVTTTEVEFPRRYVDPNADFGVWENAEKYYRELCEREVNSLEEFEQWMLDFSETDSVFDEEGTARHIAFTCATDDLERKQRYVEFIENVQPHREPWHDKLRRKFDELSQRFPLPAKRYEVLQRSIRNALELFREENIPLHVEDAKLSQQYQEITGAMTATFRGEEVTLQQLAPYLEEADRSVREETYRLAADRYLADADKLDDLYVKMVAVRDKIARNADCKDFREFAFRAKERFDYTPQDCLEFHAAIEAVVVPAVEKLAAARREKLGLPSLRPWDLNVDPDGRPPLRPFKTEDELIDGCGRIFTKVDRELGAIFDEMRARGLLDLSSRKGKAPGGYQATYHERRLPFIFMNAVGTDSDVRTLLHEGGHAFHTWAARHEPLQAYRHAPLEFCEVASMGMECLALPFTDEFYGPDTARARKRFFERIVEFFPYMAMVDALQHFVYTNVDAGIDAWKDHWEQLAARFMPHVDYTGIEAYRRHSWHRKLHFFEVPFYYIEYGIAQLGALQVWLNSRNDYQQAVAAYRNGLALGGSRPLPELFAAAGCKFDFTEKTLRPLIDAVVEEIDSIE
ncbi:MAG: M3 family oligoendopeptidase [Planctomycetota bacterium]|nr:MAG: M3 family oligoendopeptidase [Planctomycetota bacterium]